MIDKPTYDELLQGLEALMYPAYGRKLQKEDGQSPSTRGMNLLMRSRGQVPLNVPRAPRKPIDEQAPRKTRAPRMPTL